jgi:Transposase DDE domain group 1
VSRISRQRERNFKRRIKNRLAGQLLIPRLDPMFTASNIHYEVADRTRGLSCGGIGAIHKLVRAVGLVDALDRNVQLLQVHLPYHESDHILNIAYNILAGGTCLQDLEIRRKDEVYLNSLGALRIPDPTTAGDFCRRFETDADLLALMEAINLCRLKVWKQQSPEFFELAMLDADGILASTYGECKKGMGMSYKCDWSYHPLLISLANTKEPLYLVNRSGNRPSHEDAHVYLDKAIELCFKAGFQKILLRGDTDFSQTTKLDGWDDAGNVTFIFGIDAMPNLKDLAAALPESAWQRLERLPRYEVKTSEREKPENVKEQIVKERGYKNLVLLEEDVAEFEYRPGECKRDYRMIALRKKISVRKGEKELRVEYRYFFYITNERTMSATEVVLQANDRCDQENLIAQLKNGVKAMTNPLDNLYSNWAYMVMASLAWTLKAWCALLLPTPAGPWHARYQVEKQELLKMEFKRFANSLIQLPCQIVRTSRKIVYRLLSWNPWVTSLLRLSEAMSKPLLC